MSRKTIPRGSLDGPEPQPGQIWQGVTRRHPHQRRIEAVTSNGKLVTHRLDQGGKRTSKVTTMTRNQLYAGYRYLRDSSH